jgi:hypothetical protein
VRKAGNPGRAFRVRNGGAEPRGAMTFRLRFGFCLAPALALLAAAPGPTAAHGYKGYPYSIMTPEPGSAKRHRGATAIPPADTRAANEPATSTTPRYRPRGARGTGDRRARCYRRRCRERNLSRLKDRARRSCAPCHRSSRRRWCPESPGRSPICRTAPRRSRTARRVARSSKASTACRGPQAPATWARACTENRTKFVVGGLTRQSTLRRKS